MRRWGEGIEFARRRGISEMAGFMAASQLSALAEIGQIDEALSDATRLADQLEQAGDIAFVEPRSLQLRLLAQRGRHQQAPDPQPMLGAARDSGEPQYLAFALAAAAPLLHIQGDTRQARSLLAELDQTPGSRADPVYATLLPGLVRSALALNQPTLAARLLDGVEPRFPLAAHALSACRAQLAEAAGDHAQAATLYAEAAEDWRQFGNQPERAYALLGWGRSLTALGQPGADVPLTQARELFKSMGYQPALAETDTLVEQTSAAAS